MLVDVMVLVVVVGDVCMMLKVEIDIVVECECLVKEIEKLEKQILIVQNKLNNEGFVVCVLVVVVDQEKQWVVDFMVIIEKFKF